MVGCGIDFGTTNSLVSCVVDGRAQALTDEGRSHPSVIWYHGTQVKVGREARAMLDSNVIGVAGDFIRSPKSLLGKGQPCYVGGAVVRPVEAAGEVFRHLRSHAESRRLRGLSFDSTVVTVPVGMRGSGRRELREAAKMAGIAIEQFVHEPFAALYGYARRTAGSTEVLDRLQGRLALVFDWGGGTLDLTLCERVGDMLVQVQNSGNSQVGGDVFDERLMHLVVSQHMKKNGWAQPREMVPGQRAKLLASCELAKITLSSRESATVLVGDLFRGRGKGTDLEVEVSREGFGNEVQDLLNAGLREIEILLESAGQSLQSVEMCLPTGGVVAMPVVQERLLRLFGPSRCEFVERADTLIGDGAAWVAAEDVPLRLAKNIEFRHADQTWVPIVKSGQELPKGSQSSEPVILKLYCADPRSGTACIELARPKRPSRVQPADPRQCYELLRVDVRREAPPLRETIEVSLTVDPDLILHVSAVGAATGRQDGGGDSRAGVRNRASGRAGTRGFGGGGKRGRFGRWGRICVACQGDCSRICREATGRAWAGVGVGRGSCFWVKGRQESLEEAIERAYIDEYRRRPESVITLLQGLGVPCVRRSGVWIVGNPGQATTPEVLEAAPLGPMGSVVVRSNVTKREDDLEVIPGELVDELRPGFTGSARVTLRQLDELRWS